MNDLIEALQIFAKYQDHSSPTICSHDELAIANINITEVSRDDVERLDDLDFLWNEEDAYFYSFRFGSA